MTFSATEEHWKLRNTVFYGCFTVWHTACMIYPLIHSPSHRIAKMKRFLMIAVAGAALTILIPSGEAKAADHHFGRGHGYVGGHHGGAYSRFGHGYTGVHGFSRGLGHAGHRAVTPYYGSAYRHYTPRYHGGHHAPAYRSYRPAYRHGHGGVHLDVGPLHLGVGGHH